jgi:long-chain acyl-CoA synthetase
MRKNSQDTRARRDLDTDACPSVAALLRDAVATHADLPAFECLGSTMTYAEVDRAAEAVAAWLQTRLGAHRGDRIALMCPNVFAFPIAMLGVLRVGATLVNVNPLCAPRELAHQLREAGAATIFVFGAAAPVLAEVLDETPIRTVIAIDPGDDRGPGVLSPDGAVRFADVLAEGSGLRLEPVALTGDDPLFLQYTGGTTGRSKGVLLAHRNLLANIRQFRSMLPEATEPGREVLVLALPLHHIFGLMMMLTYASVGARAILIPDPRDLDGFVRAIRGARMSVLPGVNSLFDALMAHPGFADVDLTNFKIAIGGGAPVMRATSERWNALTGRHIGAGYGLSETSPVLCVTPLSVSGFTGTCGLPVPGTEIRLIDPDGDAVPAGEPGEICVRGPQVMQGYWNDPAANAAAFTADGFFRTGDVGVFVGGGFLKLVERKADAVAVAGVEVHPSEVEAVAASCEGVAECACIGVPDDATGEALRLFVVRAPGADTDAERVIAHCRGRLEDRKVPRQIVFLDALPKSSVGKILRRELRALEGRARD